MRPMTSFSSILFCLVALIVSHRHLVQAEYDVFALYTNATCGGSPVYVSAASSSSCAAQACASVSTGVYGAKSCVTDVVAFANSAFKSSVLSIINYSDAQCVGAGAFLGSDASLNA